MIDIIEWGEMSHWQKDALIAEKIFGQKVLHEADWGFPLIVKESGLTENIPHYSIDLNMAMALAVRWGHVSIECKPLPEYDVTMYTVIFIREDGRNSPASSTWAAEAICVPALRAHGYEVTL